MPHSLLARAEAGSAGVCPPGAGLVLRQIDARNLSGAASRLSNCETSSEEAPALLWRGDEYVAGCARPVAHWPPMPGGSNDRPARIALSQGSPARRADRWTRWRVELVRAGMRGCAGGLLDPELVEERSPHGVELVVADAAGDDVGDADYDEWHQGGLVGDRSVGLRPDVRSAGRSGFLGR